MSLSWEGDHTVQGTPMVPNTRKPKTHITHSIHYPQNTECTAAWRRAAFHCGIWLKMPADLCPWSCSKSGHFLTTHRYPCAVLCCAVLSCFSHVRLFVMLWTVARQAPLSVRFSRWQYWSGLPCPPPGDLPTPEIRPVSFVSCIDRFLYH